MVPDQTAPRSSLIRNYLVCMNLIINLHESHTAAMVGFSFATLQTFFFTILKQVFDIISPCIPTDNMVFAKEHLKLDP